MTEHLASPVSHDLDVLVVADYFIGLDAARPEPDVTPLKLAKLLYLAQANHLAFTGRRLFGEDVEAFDNGPLVHRAWRRHSGKQIIAVREDIEGTSEALPDDAVEFLDAVWDRFKDVSAPALWRLTHDQAPWRDNYVPGGFRIRIPDADMMAYFRDHASIDEKVLHTGVVVMPAGFLDERDADEFAAKYAAFTGE